MGEPQAKKQDIIINMKECKIKKYINFFKIMLIDPKKENDNVEDNKKNIKRS